MANHIQAGDRVLIMGGVYEDRVGTYKHRNSTMCIVEISKNFTVEVKVSHLKKLGT